MAAKTRPISGRAWRFRSGPRQRPCRR